MNLRLVAVILLLTAPSITSFAQSKPTQTEQPTVSFEELIETVEDQFGTLNENAGRFSAGSLQFVSAIERLAQGFYRLGLTQSQAGAGFVPFLRIPVPHNPAPDVVTPEAIRDVLAQFHSDMQGVADTLKTVNSTDFKLPVALGNIAMDLNGDGIRTKEERLFSILRVYNRTLFRQLKNDPSAVVHFDLADAHWLRGYSHVLMGLLDFILAHDWQPVYKQAAHVFFPTVDTAVAELMRSQSQSRDMGGIVDLVAALHVLNLPVIDRERLSRSRHHFLSMISTSREFWKTAALETDDDHEWLPNANQTAITGTQISAEMIAGWHTFLDEAELILKGEKLIPHWRIKDGRGVNLRKLFETSQTFDPVLWIQGSAAIPFLETGEITSAQTWRRLSRLFQGNFIGFAIWIN